jgi:protein-L-isoaspartate(D-aspartate) O-methyltransferase
VQPAPDCVFVIRFAERMGRVRAAGGAQAHDDGPAVEEHGWYRFVPLVADPPGGA